MKKRLRIFTLIIAVFMFLCCLPLDAFADSFVVAGEDFDYYLNSEGTYTISGYSGEDDVVEVPAYIDSIAVTELGNYSLYNNYAKKIVIPETVKKIGENALTCNDYLKEIEVSDSNPYLCDVDGILYDKGVTTIIYYPEGIEDEIFTLPESVTTLGQYSFHYAELKTVVLPQNLKKIEQRAFYGARNLNSMTLPSTLEYMGDGLFYYCESLTDIVIPDSVAYLGNYAFEGCKKLESVHFGSGLKELPENIFGGCEALESFSVSVGSKMFSVENGVLFDKNKTKLIKYPVNKSDSTYTVPSTVKRINTNAFNNTEALEYINLPDSLEFVEYEAFWELPSLKELIIPDSVTTFEYNLRYCESLEKVYIGKNVESIEPYSTFRLCKSLKKIEVSPENKNYCSVGGILFNKNKTELIKYPGGISMEGYIIPSTVTEVRASAFYDQENYNEDLEEDGEVYVGDCLLEYEGYMSKREGNISVKTGTRIIADSAFWAEDNIWGVSLPDETRVICSFAFSSCDLLQAIYIPVGVKYIGYNAFWCSDMLTDVYYGGTEAQWNKIEGVEDADLPEYVTIHFESEGNEYVNPVFPEDDYLNTYEDEESGVSVSTDTDASLSVEDVKTQEIVDSVAELLPKAKVESVYEINLQNEGEEIQPVDVVLVKIPTKNRFARVYRMEEDGTLTDMNARYEAGFLWFYTDHFSYYALGMKQAEHYELGDVDMDERINVKDATAVQKHLASLGEYQQDVIDLLMDYDQNGTLNVKDATAIQKVVAGLV